MTRNTRRLVLLLPALVGLLALATNGSTANEFSEPGTLHLELEASADVWALELAAVVPCTGKDYLAGHDDYRAELLDGNGATLAAVGLPEPRRIFIEPPDGEGYPSAAPPGAGGGHGVLVEKALVVLDLPFVPGSERVRITAPDETIVFELAIGPEHAVTAEEFGCAPPAPPLDAAGGQ